MAEAIYINTAVDVDYKPAFDKIGKIEHRLDQLTKQRDLEINVRKDKLETDLAEVEEYISEKQAMMRILVDHPDAQLQEMTERDLDKLMEKRFQIMGQLEREENKIEDINYRIQEQEQLLDNTVREQTEQEQAAQRTASAYGQVEARMKESQSLLQQLGRRFSSLIRQVFIFQLALQGLRALRSWFMQVLNANAEASVAMRQLRGALLTLVQPIIQYVIPIAIKLIRVLTMITLKIAQFIAGIFGKTLKQSAMDAGALYNSMNKTSGASAKAAKSTKKQAKNAKDTADAMAEAEGSLASFDKLNVIDSDTGSDLSLVPDVDLEDPIDDAIDDLGEIDMGPIFDFEDIGLEDDLETIYNWVLAIGAAILGFQLLKWLTKLTGSLKMAIGILMALAGAAFFVKEYINAWNEGITFEGLLKMLAAVAVMVAGLALAFGPVGAAIGMIVAGVALLTLGIRDLILNGFSYENFATIAAGLLLIGGAISILTGSWIPLLLAGLAALVLLVVEKWDVIKQFFIDLGQKIKTFFTELWSTIKSTVINIVNSVRSWFTNLGNQIKSIASTVWNTIVTAGRNALNGVIRLLNGLINGLNAILWPIRKVIVALGSVLGSRITMEDVRIPNIPGLAQGAVVPPNREFLARLGDNKTEPEIVSPLSTMQQAFAETLASSGLVGAIERDTAIQADLLKTLISAIQRKELVISPSANLGRVISKSTTLYKGVTG